MGGSTPKKVKEEEGHPTNVEEFKRAIDRQDIKYVKNFNKSLDSDYDDEVNSIEQDASFSKNEISNPLTPRKYDDQRKPLLEG